METPTKTKRTEAENWWFSRSDAKKVIAVKKVFGYDLSSDEIRRNISKKEIEDIYYIRDIL